MRGLREAPSSVISVGAFLAACLTEVAMALCLVWHSALWVLSEQAVSARLLQKNLLQKLSTPRSTQL